MKESNVIYYIQDVEKEMHMIKASTIEKLIKSKGGNDVVITRLKEGYEVIPCVPGTIDKYFDKSWRSIEE